MSPTCTHLTGLILLLVLAAVGVALSGYLCLLQGRRERYSKPDGDRDHARGWEDAHNRVARAMRMSPVELNLALLELEKADVPPISGTGAGELMVDLHRSKRPSIPDRDLSIGWGVEAFQ